MTINNAIGYHIDQGVLDLLTDRGDHPDTDMSGDNWLSLITQPCPNLYRQYR
jgi:hypothetical protein